MSDRGVISITRDRALGKTLRIALTAAGFDASQVASVDDLPRGPLDARLVVLHQEDGERSALPAVIRRLGPDGQVLLLLPQHDLDVTVEAMRRHDQVAGVLSVETLSAHQLSAVATRILKGDIFGLEKVLPWGAQVHSVLIGDYQEKVAAIERVTGFAEALGVRRKVRESIEQCCDEMLMNALYDAPDAARGIAPKKRSAPRAGERPALPPEDRALLEYGCDGHHFALSVRDRFGRLERSVLMRYLDKCLHDKQQIDRKPGGAGLGLYLMCNSASSLFVNLLPGVATECLCTFDIHTSGVRLEQLGVFRERVDAHGRLMTGPRRVGRFPVERRRRVPTIEKTEVVVRQARRAGAAVGRVLALVATATALAAIAVGAVMVAPHLLRAWADDNPAGAHHQSMASPAQVVVRPMVPPHHASRQGPDPSAAPDPAPGPTPTPTPSPTHPVAAAAAAHLRPGAATGSLTITSDVPARATVLGTACRNRPLPLRHCRLKSGTYQVAIHSDAPRLDYRFSVAIERGPVTRDLQFGMVEARKGYTVTATGESPQHTLALPPGRHGLVLVDKQGTRTPLWVPVHAHETVLIP